MEEWTSEKDAPDVEGKRKVSRKKGEKEKKRKEKE